MTNILRKFPNDQLPPEITKAEGVYYYLKNGKKLLDTTSGWTSYATLGFSNKRINDAMIKQMEKFTHIDFNIWNNPMLENLSEKLINHATNGLDKVYFGGTSGSDAVDAAMKLSYQVHFDSGRKNKKLYISRVQSFNGATLHAMSVSDLPILKIYDGLLPKGIHKISQHNPYADCKFDIKNNVCECKKHYSSCMGKFKNENDEEYLSRQLDELESKINEIGSENICAFIGETQLGSLVGDVPPLKDYWSKVYEICSKNNIHVILDEVYCGMGRSGKIFNYSWYDFSPDFVCVGKNMTSGHAPLSAIITKSKFQDIIAKGSGRIQLGHTFQGYSLGVAACYELMNIIEEDKLMDKVSEKGAYMIDTLKNELKENPFYKNIRGKGFAFSLEHQTSNNPKFGILLQQIMKEKYDIIINSKWHRTSFVPSFIINDKEIDKFLSLFIKTFKEIQSDWTKLQNTNIDGVSKSMGAVEENK